MKNLAVAVFFLIFNFIHLASADCPPCPAGGVWSDWNQTTTCTATCGLCGELVQKRTCSSYKWGCPCTGPYSRKQPCPQKPCPSPQCCDSYTVTNSKCGPLPTDPTPATETCADKADACWCPPNGIWSAWKANGSCSMTCGLCGTVPQTRTCLSADWGCDCVGADTRSQVCPNSPCPTAGSECCRQKVVVTNLLANVDVCGVILPDDPVYADTCKCNNCNGTDIAKIVDPPNSPFNKTVVFKTGCYKYVAACVSLDGYPAYIEFNNGTSGTVKGTPKIQLQIQCASDGSGWQYTDGGTTVAITAIGCIATTCTNSPQLCPA